MGVWAWCMWMKWICVYVFIGVHVWVSYVYVCDVGAGVMGCDGFDIVSVWVCMGSIGLLCVWV